MLDSPDHTTAPHVLAEAIQSFADRLQLTTAVRNALLGLAPNASLARIIDPDSVLGERATCVLRIYDALCRTVGDRVDNQRHWLTTYNHGTEGIPLEQMHTPEGIRTVMEYLEAFA